MSSPVFLASTEALDHNLVTLAGAEGRHAANVRRLAVGESIELTDGVGTRAQCLVEVVRRDEVELRVVSRRLEPAATPRLVVVQALPKGDRGEQAVELMTEAGVDEIVPWAAARCVTRWHADRVEKSLGRWRATAREAAKQSRRSWIPMITEPASTREVAARLVAAALAVVLHEGAGVALSTVTPPVDGEVVVVVGPEGGLTDEELTAFASASYRLGPEVVRTSTAGALAAAVLLSHTARWS